ncbi:MAG: T9SS type A sorting domain-containing protein [Tannerella sp.]|nr:T9SS type A sorting domain-containing protein [Tannerella sp.]
MEKLKQLFLILVGLCFTGFVSAQLDCTIDGPSHPLKPVFGLPRILADTVHIKTYVLTGHSSPPPPSWTNVYTFHENNRIDTICNVTGGQILKYSDKGQLLSKSRYAPGYVSVNTGEYVAPWEVLDVEFEYGEDGRMLKTTQYGFDGDSSYVDSVYTYNYTMTDSGYIVHNQAECILDDQGRVTHIKGLDDSKKVEYVYDEEGRQFRVGETYYFYFENGFRSLIYSHRGQSVLGAPDAWSRIDYFFQENGYLKEKIDYLKDEGETEWRVYNHDEWFYYYKDDNPLANITIEEQPGGTVYATAGAVMIGTEAATTVSVYSFSGQLVTQQRISAGTNRIALSKGLYIIVVNDKGYKIVVK